MKKRANEIIPEENLTNPAVTRCPRCGNLSLRYTKAGLLCSVCGYQENIPRMK